MVIFACPLSFGKTFSLGLAHWVHLVLQCFHTVCIGKISSGMKHTEVLNYLKFLLESFQLQFLFLLLLRKWGALEVGTPQAKKAPRPANSTLFHFPIRVQHLMHDLVSAERRGFSWSNWERETASSIGEQKENRTMPAWRFLKNREQGIGLDMYMMYKRGTREWWWRLEPLVLDKPGSESGSAID